MISKFNGLKHMQPVKIVFIQGYVSLEKYVKTKIMTVGI